MSIAYIGIGSNLNDKSKNLDEACELIGKNSSIQVLQGSSTYQTEPVGIEDQPDFLNMVLEIKTALSPFELHNFLQSVEKKMGRNQERRGGSRNIDLDLLLYEQEVVSSDKLTLPHPRMHLRKFVLMPMAEIVKNKVHPLIKKTIIRLLEDLKEDSKVEVFKS